MRFGFRKIIGNFSLFLFFIVLFIIPAKSFAAESDLDTSYTPTVSTGGGRVVYSIVVQPDGKALIGGTFIQVNGQTRNFITRLNLDGTLDSTFSAAITANLGIYRVLLQPDGKIIAVGAFSTFNGASAGRIVRLNSDGTVDNTFVSSVGADNRIQCAALQSDGKILIGGDFTTYNAVSRAYIARLNSDGMLDATFNSTVAASTSAGAVRVIVPQSGGTIYLGGGFTSVNSVNRTNIARLNGSGSLDTTFVPPTTTNSYIESIVPLAGGSVLVGGSFVNFFGSDPPNALMRLNSGGGLDATFNANVGQSSIVYNITPQSSGKFLLSGSINSLNGGSRKGIVRINADGTSDAAFNVNAGSNGTINATALQPDGKILIGGQFVSYNGVSQAPLARLVGMPTTAAAASISGRIIGGGRGLANARIQLIGTGGVTLTVTTNAFGYFQFREVETGATYIVTASAKRMTFAPQVVSVTNEISGLIFNGTP